MASQLQNRRAKAPEHGFTRGEVRHMAQSEGYGVKAAKAIARAYRRLRNALKRKSDPAQFTLTPQMVMANYSK